MNIFENYLSKKINIVESNKNLLGLENLRNLNNINLEVPPEHFNFDLSTNISLVLAKKNNLNPKDLAHKIKDLLLAKIGEFHKIEIAGPGFLNIKFSKQGIVQNINNIFK